MRETGARSGCDQQQAEPKGKAASPSAPSVRADYEFQETCGKAAAEWFRIRYKNGMEVSGEMQLASDFSNHYSRKKNKCFVLAVGSVISKTMSQWQELHDVHENKQYGRFFKSQDGFILCEFLEVPCASDAEWKQKIKPYMED